MKLIFLTLFVIASLSACSCKPNLARLLGKLLRSLDESKGGLRPYVRSRPAAIWRVGRDVKTKAKTNYCVIIHQKLLCTDDDQDIECSIEKNLKDSTLENFKQFTIIEVNAGPGRKQLNLYPKRNNGTLLETRGTILTLHSIESKANQGFTVLDKQCWTQLVEFLSKNESAAANSVGKLVVL